MSPQILSTILLRLLGFWFLCEALFGLGNLFFLHRDLMAGLPPGVHRRYYEGSQLAMGSTDYPHDTYYYVRAPFAPGLVAAGVRLTAGLLFLFAAKPMARLLSRNLDPS
ncbi:MAG: hypothetical protein ABJF10_09770 [Chthoniobacter sp.]|uniref:hypothetical protein n=1 Tax=Chthoniobacter sp. TaxID=2510640 RepID=UPI0032A8A7BC